VISARGRHGDRLPDKTLEIADLSIDRDQLAGYAEVCSFRHSDVLPPTYPHILGFPLAVTLMVDPSFPFPLAGLVHVGNRITQQRSLRADERITVGVRAQNLRDHTRGRQFDMITEATLDGQPVWTEASTYLRREHPHPDTLPTLPSPQSGEGKTASGEGKREEGDVMAPTAIWRVPANIGRRYAAVSGDVNPIHLNPLAAKLFGFRRAIAHGMWVQARCLSALEGRLPEAVTITVSFKSPLLLPSTVAFSAHEADGAWNFAVFQPKSGKPHLGGTTKGLPRPSARPALPLEGGGKERKEGS
jgi:acyl dehydratase